MTQKDHQIYPELTLAQFRIKLFFSQGLQCYSQVLYMFIRISGINQDIINEDNYKLVQVGLEDFVHQCHECCRCISQPKRHYTELIVPVPRPECCLWYI